MGRAWKRETGRALELRESLSGSPSFLFYTSPIWAFAWPWPRLREVGLLSCPHLKMGSILKADTLKCPPLIDFRRGSPFTAYVIDFMSRLMVKF